MKIKNIIVTFWFNRYNNIKDIFEIFNSKLGEYFPAFNMTNLPSNVDPIIPRITARSKSGHSTFNMSNINVQLITDYDEKYNTNFENCLNYIEERVKKIYEILVLNQIEVLYSAIFVNLDKIIDSPIDMIKNNLLSESVRNNTFSEVGMRTSMIVEDKFYRILTINNAKDFTMQKQIVPGQNEIIMPLISLHDAEIVNEYISISYELNDKYSFDSVEDYKNNSDIMNKMFEQVKNDLSNNIEEFIQNGTIK